MDPASFLGNMGGALLGRVKEEMAGRGVTFDPADSALLLSSDLVIKYAEERLGSIRGIRKVKLTAADDCYQLSLRQRNGYQADAQILPHSLTVCGNEVKLHVLLPEGIMVTHDNTLKRALAKSADKAFGFAEKYLTNVPGLEFDGTNLIFSFRPPEWLHRLVSARELVVLPLAMSGSSLKIDLTPVGAQFRALWGKVFGDSSSEK